MSMCTEIVCNDCRKRLWIGQNSWIYTGELETMDALDQFLQLHRNHSLKFGYFDDCPEADYEDVGRYEEDGEPEVPKKGFVR